MTLEFLTSFECHVTGFKYKELVSTSLPVYQETPTYA